MTWIADLEEERRRLQEMIDARGGNQSPSVRLGMRSLERRLDEIGKSLKNGARPHVSLHLTGPPVHGHEILVKALAPVLDELQETISSIGQALRGAATASSSIPADIRQETALTVEAFTPGSVVIHLRTEPDRRVVEPSLFEGILQGDDQPLAIAAMDRLIGLTNLARSGDSDDDALVEDVFPLGPRTYAHLNRLMKSLMENELEADINVTSPIEGERGAFLGTSAVKRIYDVLRRTNVAVETSEFLGELRGVSSVRNAFELLLPEGTVLSGKVREDLVPQLRKWYEKRVLATFDVTVTRSLTTGTEYRRHLLVGLSEVPVGGSPHGTADTP
jgi:hypothetical protein